MVCLKFEEKNMKTPSPFSSWMRDHLKDAYSGLITQDIDFVLTFCGNYFIVEEKLLLNARTGPAQAVIYKMFDDILSKDNKFFGCHKVVVNGPNNVFLDEQKDVNLDFFLLNPYYCYKNTYNQTWFEKIIYFNIRYLWDGKGEPPVRKTEKEHTFNRESKLEIELAKKDDVQQSRIDWVFVNYVSGNYCLLFESDKYLNDPTIQRIISILEKETPTSGAINPKTNVRYHFCGAHKITYNREMTEFQIDGHRYTSEQVIKILNLDEQINL